MEVLNVLKEVLIGAAGAGVGFLVARNVLEKKYARLLDEEIRRTKEFFGEYNGPENPEFMDQAIKTAEAMSEYSGGEVVVNPAVLAQEVTKTMTAYNKPGAPTVDETVKDIESNMAAAPPDPDARPPYIITTEEFMAAELDYEQITLSFFAGDGIVMDEDNNVISPDRVEQIVGTDNLNRFGTNTEDPAMEPHVLYVRCERFNMDFEVLRSPGSHAVEVLGQTG
jgi:hypothetical protein